MLWRNMLLPPSGLKRKPAAARRSLHFFAAYFMVGLLFNREHGGDVPSKHQPTSNGVYNLISQDKKLLRSIQVTLSQCLISVDVQIHVSLILALTGD
jgi:hypothetical protein